MELLELLGQKWIPGVEEGRECGIVKKFGFARSGAGGWVGD